MQQIPVIATEYFVDWLKDNATLVSATDFTGFLFEVHKKKKIAGRCDLFGNVSIFTTGDKPLTRKQAEYWTKWCFEHNVIQFDNEPFPEFSRNHNIQVDYSKMDFIEEKLFC